MNTQGRAFRWLMPIAGLFVTCLIISNIIAVKLINIGGLILPAAVVLFPITYIIGDVLTEVYGYGRARQVIWMGFFCNLIAVLAFWIAGLLPAASFWNAGTYGSPDEAMRAYRAILGFTPRLLVASFIAYLAGEFLNSLVLAKIKIRTGGRFLWIRTIGSTIVGQAADSTIFITIAFVGIISGHDLAITILSQWLFKVSYETAATPLTYLVVNSLKRAEGVDYFDTGTNFNPLKLFGAKSAS
jgi:uncharacterized integral membrane protein (TIGR00697 family)